MDEFDKMSPIYFDNAASTHPKPEDVYLETDRVFRHGGSPGRSAHAVSVSVSKIVFENRLAIAEFLNAPSPDHLIFTPGCTQSINMVLNGIGLRKNDIVLVSALEHNSVMRALHHFQKNIGINIISLPYAPGSIINRTDLQTYLSRGKVRICAFMEASNVTGEILGLAEVAKICHDFQVPLLVDAAQTAGYLKSDLSLAGITYWSTSGHKGLLGAPGLGLLYVKPGFEIDPFVCGGTGSRSEQFEMPDALPDRLEPGTMSAPLIAALGAGVRFLQNTGIEVSSAHELSLTRELLNWLLAREQFRVVGDPESARVPLVSFEIKGVDSGYVAEILDREYGICTRAGLHCAAAAHKVLGTTRAGLVRVSFGYFNTLDELTVLFKALEEIAKGARI